MDKDDWISDTSDENDLNDQLDSTSEFKPVLIESVREGQNVLTKAFTTTAKDLHGDEMLHNSRDFSSSVLHGGEMLPNAYNFTRTTNVFHAEDIKCLPPLIVHKRPWPGALSTAHKSQTIQRIRSKSFDVPDIVITAESKDDKDSMPQKTLAKQGNQRSHFNVSLPSIIEQGKLAPPVFDSSSRATYQPGLRRHSTSCVRLPKLPLNKNDEKKDDGY